MFKIKILIAAAALAATVAAPALATPPQATANLVNGNSGILVEAYGDGSVQVTDIILITPDGNEVRAASVNSNTQTETVTSTTNSGGGQPAGTLSLGTGYSHYNGHNSHSGSYNSVGLGFAIPLGGSNGGSSTTTQTVTTTTSEGLIELPFPMHYLQLWQDYRIEVVYRENGVEKVVTVPTPRPRSASS